jgi:hypothetical protein
MTIWYTARNTFDKTHSGWANYIKFSGLTMVQEIVSLDFMLCDPAFKWNPDKAEDWEYAITDDNEVFNDCYSNLKYVIDKVDKKNSFNLLAVCFKPTSSCENIFLTDFTFIGYDLIDQSHGNSALTNCGGTPEVFANSELNKFGLLDKFERAQKIQADLLINDPNEYHADTNIWSVWRHNTLGKI